MGTPAGPRMIFTFYLLAMAMAVMLSFFNLRRGDIRLSGLAIGYTCIVAGFHLVFMTWLKLDWHSLLFYLFVAGAQGGIAYMAYEVGCRAARVMMPLAWFAVALNCITLLLLARYPHAYYFYAMNFIQCSQIASLYFASSVWELIACKLGIIPGIDDDSMKQVVHERTG